MMNIETLNETALPGMLSGSKQQPAVTSENFAVRYYQANLSDLAQVGVLENLLTQGLDGKNVVILEKDKYSFQDQYYVVITYLEKKNAGRS